MIVERLPEPIDALVIRETFDENELSEIMNEIKSLSQNIDNDGIWISDVYKDMNMSSINRNNIQKFFTLDLVHAMSNMNSLYGIYGHVNNHNTQIKRYENGQSSILHYDAAAFTIMTILFEGEKNFDGGNVTLQVGGDIAYEQYIENNMTFIFPSSYYVAISELSANGDSTNAGLYAVSSYLFIESR